MMAKHPLRDYLQLHLVILAWGFTAILGKLITIPALEVVAWRTAMASLGLALVAKFAGASLRVPSRLAWSFFGIGVLVGLHWFTFFLSARLATASVSLAALPTVMIWCSLIEPLIDGTRRWRITELLVGVIMVGAVWIIYRFEFTHWLGFTVGLLSAFLAASFALINKHLTKREHPAVVSFWQMIGAFAISLVLLPFFNEGKPALPNAENFLWLLVLSQVCTVGAYLGYMDILRRMSVFTINVVYNLEPVYGIVLAALIFGDRERMSGGFYLGAGIIVAAVIALPMLSRKGDSAASVAGS